MGGTGSERSNKDLSAPVARTVLLQSSVGRMVSFAWLAGRVASIFRSELSNEILFTLQ
jgi:hypothetical protein